MLEFQEKMTLDHWAMAFLQNGHAAHGMGLNGRVCLQWSWYWEPTKGMRETKGWYFFNCQASEYSDKVSIHFSQLSSDQFPVASSDFSRPACDDSAAGLRLLRETFPNTDEQESATALSEEELSGEFDDSITGLGGLTGIDVAPRGYGRHFRGPWPFDGWS